MKKVIITGPTGTIGHALIDILLENGVEVYAICRPNSSKIRMMPQNELFHVIEQDLSSLLDKKNEFPRDCDVFYHLGWTDAGASSRNNMSVQTSNIQYTLDAVDLAAYCGCHTFIGAGSQAECGRVNERISGNTPTFPENGYGMAKLCAGQMSRVKATSLGMKHVWTRILSVYGPYNDPRTMIMSIINKILKGEKPSCTLGEQLWDFIYSKDVGRILFELGTEKSESGKVYIIGSGKAYPLRDYIEIIRDKIDPNTEIGFGDIPYSNTQVMYLCADNSDLIEDLHYEYAYDFQTGISETIEWCKAHLTDFG